MTSRSVVIACLVASVCGVAAASLPTGEARAQQPPVRQAAQPVAADTTHGVPQAPAILIGHVLDSAGVPVAGAQITIEHADRMPVVTSDSGEFRITGLPAGPNTFDVRRLGFQAATFTAVLKPGRVQRAKFVLTAMAQALPTVAVSDTANTHWLDTFERRKGSNRGTFVTRDQITKYGARSGPDILRTIPGIRLVPRRSGFGSQVLMTRGAGARSCVPTMFVHNTPYSGTLDDFTADDIEALEVYIGISEIPAELDKNGKGICGAIVIWTRDPRKAP